MLDRGAGSSYIIVHSSKLDVKPCHSERKVIAQMYAWNSRQANRDLQGIYACLESNAPDDFGIELQCIYLTYIPNPCIPELKKNNHRIRRLPFSEGTSKEDQLPVHVILGEAVIQLNNQVNRARKAWRTTQEQNSLCCMSGDWEVHVLGYRDENGFPPKV